MMECDVLLLLRLVALFYPVTVSALVQIRRPVALIVSDGSIIQPLIRFIGSEKSLITENMSIEKATKVIRLSEINPVICIGRNKESIPQRVEDLWRFLIDASRLSEIAGEQLKTQILFIFNKRIPTMYMEDFFRIYISKTDFPESFSDINLSRFNGACLDWRELESICHSYDVDGDELRAFFTVIDLAAKYDDSIDVVKLKEIAEQVVAYDEETEDVGDVTGMFREELYNFVENTHSCRIYQLPNVETCAITQIDRVMFFDSDYLYMSDSLFRVVTGNMRQIFPADVIKGTLSAEDVLKGGSGRYASKMTLVTPYGESKRPCMLRFLREKLNKLGEMDLVDVCKRNMEEMQ